MTAEPAADADDVGRVLGLFGRPTWLLFALCCVVVGYTELVLGGPDAHTPASLAALVVVLATLLLIVLPAPTPLPLWRTVTILAVIVLVTAAVVWQMKPPFGPPDSLSYRPWMLNPCDLLLFCLAIRGRIVSAWVGQLLLQATVAAWSLDRLGAVWYGLSFSYTQAFPLLAVTVFSLGLTHTARVIVAHREAERDRVRREEQDTATVRDIEDALRAVRDLAGPMLDVLAAGGYPPVAEVRGLEAALRDRIRGRNLAEEPLAGVLRSVRGRGVDVVVLDDLDADLDPAVRAVVLAWCAAQVGTATGAALTLRAAGAADDPHITLTADGAPYAEYRLPSGTARVTPPAAGPGGVPPAASR